MTSNSPSSPPSGARVVIIVALVGIAAGFLVGLVVSNAILGSKHSQIILDYWNSVGSGLGLGVGVAAGYSLLNKLIAFLDSFKSKAGY